MRTLLLSCLALVLSIRMVEAQNLVPNPSFENLIQCPFTVGQLNFASDWFIAGGTPDLFSGCTGSNLLGVPSNARGHQDALHGQTYGFTINYSLVNANYREIIGVQINQPLIIGQKYFYSFFVSLADTIVISCSSNNFGIKFSNTLYDIATPIVIDNNPHSFFSTIISNKDIWTVVRGSFVSDSAYSFMYLGNFFDDINTDTLSCYPNSFYSGYFIDQICLSPDSLSCELYTHNSNSPEDINYSLNSNIISNTIIVNCSNTFFGKIQHEILEISGKVVKYGEFQTQPVIEIPFEEYSSGVYIIRIKSQLKVYTFKILKL
jgi:hypothetical protein